MILVEKNHFGHQFEYQLNNAFIEVHFFFSLYEARRNMRRVMRVAINITVRICITIVCVCGMIRIFFFCSNY